ncbi:MAG: hypothetical protein ACI8PZ_001874 [Myxococcota bacterium]|jgi:hypothetical protein
MILLLALPAFAGLFYWDGPGYGDDSYSGGDGVWGQDGKGVELQGTAPLGNPGNGGNTVDYVPGGFVWAVFEVVSDVRVDFGRMKLKLYDGHLGAWQDAKVMSLDDTYGGPGYRYVYNAVIHDGGLGDLYPSDGIKYYFQEWDGFACLPASACIGGPYLDAPDVTEGEPLPEDLVVRLSEYNEVVFVGERLGFVVNLENPTADRAAFDRVEMEITAADVDVTRVLYDAGPAEIPLDPGAALTKSVTLGVPEWAPLGDYHLDVVLLQDGVELGRDGYDFVMDAI